MGLARFPDQIIGLVKAIFGLSPSSSPGTLVAQQPGGVAGTDEIQIYHTGAAGFIDCKDGSLNLRTTSPADINITSTGGVVRVASAVDADRFIARNGGSVAASILGNTTPDSTLFAPVASILRWSDAAGTGPGGPSALARSPTPFTGTQNNYAPGTGFFQRWSGSSTPIVTGMVAGQDGETRLIWNVGATAIVINNADAGSTAANQFLTSTGAALSVAQNKCALTIYDATTAKWRITLLP